MSTAAFAPATHPHWAIDYLSLTKPRILVMIAFTVAAGAFCVGITADFWPRLVQTLIGTMLVAAAASVINQVIERESDAVMKRTADRPLPMGRLTTVEASVFGWLLLAIGCTQLAMFADARAAVIATLTFALYVGVYTPLKRRSVWNTAVGTLPGALPVLIGCCGVGGSLLDPAALLLTAIVVLWQFPHFMSIAWLFREDYERGGYRMWTTSGGSREATGWHASVGAAAIIPAVLALAWTQWDSASSFALVMGATVMLVAALQQFWAAVRFHQHPDDITARRLLRSSLLVLPVILTVFIALAV